MKIIKTFLIFNLIAVVFGCNNQPQNMNVTKGTLSQKVINDSVEKYSSIMEEDFWKDKPNPKAGEAAKGKILYNANCKSCHGLNGEGKKSKNISPLTVKTITDGLLFFQTSTGFGEKMKGYHQGLKMNGKNFNNSLSEDEVWQIVDYVKTLSKVE